MPGAPKGGAAVCQPSPPLLGHAAGHRPAEAMSKRSRASAESAAGGWRRARARSSTAQTTHHQWLVPLSVATSRSSPPPATTGGGAAAAAAPVAVSCCDRAPAEPKGDPDGDIAAGSPLIFCGSDGSSSRSNGCESRDANIWCAKQQHRKIRDQTLPDKI